MADSAEATTAEPQPAPQEGLGLQKGSSPHEAAKALSERRKRVAASTAPIRDAVQTLQPAEPEQTTEQPDETARDAAESQGNGADVAPEVHDDGGTEETGSGDFPTTFKGLAEALEVDPEDLAHGLTVTRKVNGQDTEITVAEALEGYLRQSDYSRSQNELADARRAFEAERDQTLERAKQQITTAENWMGVAAKALQAGPDEAQLAELARTDPQQYAVENARRQNLLAAYNQFATERQRMVDEANQEAAAERAKVLEAERGVLVRMSQDKNSGIPSPDDAEKWPVFEGKIRQYLGSVGFKNDEVSEFLTPGNWRASQVRIIADAMYGRAVRAKGEGVGKKVKHLPKTLKPGAPKDRSQSNAEKVARARANLRKNPKGQAGHWNAVALLRANRAAQKGG